MKRYIIRKEGLNLLQLETLNAIQTLGSDIKITNEQLEYSNIPYASVVLDESQVQVLKEAGIEVNEEKNEGGILLIDFLYEQTRSYWKKNAPKFVTGAGCKVGNIDTGCNIAHVPVDFAYNAIDATTNITDVYGHGTYTTSIIKSPQIGLANGCELHMIKAISDTGTANESAMLAALDYAIEEELDVINLSFTYSSVAFDAAILDVIAAGIVIVAAAGNSTSPTTTLSPASINGVVAVNAIKEDGTVHYQNVIAPPGGHGITVACSGYSTTGIRNDGEYWAVFGTSFSSPFFAGVFALWKERLGLDDNYAVLQHVLDAAVDRGSSLSFGVGTPTF